MTYLEPHMKTVMDYILDTEVEDFIDNLSDTHVYFHALCVTEGENYARYYLDGILAKHKDA